MKVVLCENIRGLGSTGQIVKVKDGFGRNYLLPKRLAVQPSESNVKRLRTVRESYLLKEKGRIESARLIASKMDDLTLTVPMKSNDGGQLFGSVTEQIVAENLGKAIGVEIHPQQVILGSHFKRVGEYFAAIRLHSEVEIELPVHVVAEGGADEDETGMAKVMEAAESDEDLVDEAEETPVED